MIKKRLKKIVLILIFAALAVLVVMLYIRLLELTNQMAYLQDTTDVILSDVGNLQSNFEKTLEEENSMIESYEIDVTDMDFTQKTYQADVTVIPKEYTDETKVSVFFGTAECALTADGYTYSGSITLPLEKTFDGNLTFLIANGKKKNTEVIKNYEGLYNHLDQVLTGSLADDFTYRDGVISLDTECSFTLDGGDQYEFDSLLLVVALDGEEIESFDLLANPYGGSGGSDANDSDTDNDSAESLNPTDTEALSTTLQMELPIAKWEATVPCEFTYSLKEHLAEDEEIPENPDIRIYLTAVSTEGYRFECGLSGGTERVVYDRRGGSYELGDNVTDSE